VHLLSCWSAKTPESNKSVEASARGLAFVLALAYAIHLSCRHASKGFLSLWPPWALPFDLGVERVGAGAQ
jgi:hypothetical protein